MIAFILITLSSWKCQGSIWSNIGVSNERVRKSYQEEGLTLETDSTFQNQSVLIYL